MQLRTPVAIALVAGSFAFGLSRACAAPAGGVRAPGLSGAGGELAGRTVTYALHAGTGVIDVRSANGSLVRSLELSVGIDEQSRPLDLGSHAMRTEGGGLAFTVRLDLGGNPADGLLELSVDHGTDALVAELSVSGAAADTHTVALRAEIDTEGRPGFVSGVGELSDLGAVKGGAVVLAAEPRPIGIVSARGPLEVAAVVEESPEERGVPMRVAVKGPKVEGAATSDLRIVLGASSTRIWGTLFRLSNVATSRVRGVVTGARAQAKVYGLDAQGALQVAALVGPDGRFSLDVPETVALWYAALDPARTSAPVPFTPGTPWELRLDISPGGELHVRVTDADRGGPLTARLIVRGDGGTLDPSFGPDYRASGAGPIIDALRGDVATAVPAGRYRVAATKGIEWSIDSQTVEVAPGASVAVNLALRHVVPTPGVVGWDLHVHARPSFDTPVQPEDRVLSLVAAGVDFAVPSEHNIVGDYGPPLSAQGLDGDLAYVNGVEVTPFAPRFGHFGVYPYPKGQRVPPFRHTNVSAVFAAARRGDPNRILQVNHPRLPFGIGYFDVFGYDTSQPHPPRGMRFDFDALEVYNGYDLARPERVDAVMRDYFALLNQGHHYVATGSSDSHRIQYQWAGYPRTMVAAGEEAAGDRGAPVDPVAVIDALRKGRAVVTSGPVLEVDLDGAHPGDELRATEDPIPMHLRVRAAPWVDVTSIEIVVGGQTVDRIGVPPRPSRIGAELGSLADAQGRTLRFDQNLEVEVGPESTWLIVVVRGERRLDDVLPFMPVVPMGFSNPIWVTRPPPLSPALPPQGRGKGGE